MTVVETSSTWSQMLEAKTNFSTSRQKSKRFFGVKKQHSEHKGARSFQKKKQNKKVYDKCNAEYSFFKWEISLVHYKRGYSGPGHAGGVCSSVFYVMSGGPSILIVCYIMCTSLYMSIKETIFIS